VVIISYDIMIKVVHETASCPSTIVVRQSNALVNTNISTRCITCAKIARKIEGMS